MTWLALALANDCDQECFELSGWERCEYGVQATAVSQDEVEVLMVLSGKFLEPWSLARDGEPLLQDVTFRIEDAVDDDVVTNSDCGSSHGYAFVYVDEGVSAGTHLYTLSGGWFDWTYEDSVTLEDEESPGDSAPEASTTAEEAKGCGCGSVPLPGAILGALMLLAGALTTRRGGPSPP